LVTSTEYGADVSDYLLSKLSFDVLAIGNHEMYKYDVVKSVYDRIQEGRW
jgi:2',3'-cyclic-nucleotide 2'-phosphodiesterase (5'-nucleotidase family)